jgi:RNA polymerase sigma-70 factor, ECF subfamily
MPSHVRIDDGFAALADRHRRELQAHCYRMVGSPEDAQDLVQETFLRAWRSRASFQGRSTPRAWLYRIATNACFDFLARSARGGPALALQPEDGAAPRDDEPDSVAVAKETIELALLVAIRNLSSRQRATLILRDLLGWSAKETAEVLETSVVAVNSTLYRARETLRQHLPLRRAEWARWSRPNERERAELRLYLEAYDREDVTALRGLLQQKALGTASPARIAA